ncbi:hypothetical protein EU528_07895 [Candidatus Thorarchaeota archaeon]|nr:MAG: hypothetical protein EU528_07895 [Candidatus Thorarchaeota archaeon]
MPFSEFLDILRPILKLYDNCDYESAAILARKELGLATEKSLKILLQSFVHYFEGHSRWESSYDYGTARSFLKKTQEVIEESLDFCSEIEKQGMMCLSSLSGVLGAAINLENALISVDANAMTSIAKELSNIATEGLGTIKHLEMADDNLPSWFQSQLVAWELYGRGVAAYSEAMASLRTDKFEKIYSNSEDIIKRCMEGILEQDDEDSYSELSSYLEFLRYHYKITKQNSDYLVLKGNRLTWLFNFWGESELLNSVYNSLISDSSQFEEQMKRHGISIDTIDEDSLSDLFETVLGEERMKNLVISLKPLVLNFRGEELQLRMSVRIYRYGVATIQLEADIEELSVSDLRVCLSFCGPHSAEFDIEWEDRSYTRLSTIAEEIVAALDLTFESMGTKIPLRFVPHLNWYGYVLIQRGLWSRGESGDRLLNLEEASKFLDYKGLLLGQMEARAALDDWIMREPIGIRNLAPIRSHTTDLLVSTENHGVLSFPDDPRWIVLQYQETIETSVRLRCLISTFIEIAGEILDTFIEETSDLSRDLETMELEVAEKRISETRRQLLPVIHFDTAAHMNIELIRGTLTSNYRDHAALMRALIDDLNVDRMVNYLERRLGILSHHQTLFSDIASGVVERRAKERERRETEMENRRTKSMEFVEIFISILAIGEVISILFGAIRNLEIEFAPAIEPITYFVAMAIVFLFIMHVRRTNRVLPDSDSI